jgi:hypothetical protein
MNKKKTKQTRAEEKLNILACDLYFACYDPDIAQHPALFNALKHVLSILQETTGKKSPHIPMRDNHDHARIQ